MLFEISRTSDYTSKEKPCKEAFPIKIKPVEYTLFKTPEEFDKMALNYGIPKWFKKGTNHRIINGYIARDLEGEKNSWGIEINTLEDFIKLKNQTKEELIITNSDINSEFPSIEIYDDYRD